MTRLPTFVLAALTLVPAVATLAPSRPAAAQAAPAPVREIEIVVQGGYQPSRVVINEGERVRLRFVRREYTGCTREVVFPSLNLRRELPPNQPVVIELPPLPAGEVPFHCGMHMIHGTLVVQPRH
jgi:plastocyanin domain-containing protein